jgi:pimeloyl-ACP methyl ester carboxylesterase
VVVPGSGHSVQGDRPLELAALLREAMAVAT